MITFGETANGETEGLSSYTAEEGHLLYILKQVDSLSDGTADNQTQAYNLLKSKEQEVSIEIHGLCCKEPGSQLRQQATLTYREEPYWVDDALYEFSMCLIFLQIFVHSYELWFADFCISLQYPKNAEILWRLAKATRNMATIQEGNTKEKESLIQEGNVWRT